MSFTTAAKVRGSRDKERLCGLAMRGLVYDSAREGVRGKGQRDERV